MNDVKSSLRNNRCSGTSCIVTRTSKTRDRCLTRRNWLETSEEHSRTRLPQVQRDPARPGLPTDPHHGLHQLDPCHHNSCCISTLIRVFLCLDPYLFYLSQLHRSQTSWVTFIKRRERVAPRRIYTESGYVLTNVSVPVWRVLEQLTWRSIAETVHLQGLASCHLEHSLSLAGNSENHLRIPQKQTRLVWNEDCQKIRKINRD